MLPLRFAPRAALFLTVIPALTCSRLGAAADRDWSVYLGDKAASHYSSLAQITPANVTQLEVAWTWHTGDARPDTSQIQCNPLEVDGRLYATTAQQRLVALEAASGRELWRFDPAAPGGPTDASGVNRGVAYWADGDDRRILYGAGHWLHALDARTGQPIDTFGDHGHINLEEGLDREVRGMAIQANTPGVIFRDLIIMGTRMGEGPAPAAPGHLRAYNVRTGKLAWTFHTIPQPGEPGYETWPPDAWKHVGGVNVWPGFALDEERGLVFCPVGSATFDFWGGDRVGDNLYADCLLVLDAATGRHVWHHQFTHHDLWDRDPPAPPSLLTVRRDGQQIPAVAQVTKTGHVWVFRRDTGESLFPIEEIATPSSDLAGEVTSPVQSLPVKPAPFVRQLFTADEITNRTPAAHRAVLERFARLRAHVRFEPPSEGGTIIFPGFDGGAEWGGAAVDPEGVIYVNANEMPWILTMISSSGASSPGEQVYLQTCTACHGADRVGNPAQNIPSLVDLSRRRTPAEVMAVIEHGRGFMPPFGFLNETQRSDLVAYLLGTAQLEKQVETIVPGQVAPPPYTHTGYTRWLDPEGYPAVKPPWGTLSAIDLNTGEYRWKIPFGEFPELVAQGQAPTGAENYGGPLVTASGVLFIGASKDENFRAIDRATGRELWRFQLPAAGYATPATYEVAGRQYVVIACGGGKVGTKSSDAYVAFALPVK